MPGIRRLVLVRHGETDGESSTRFHGAGNVGLSPTGEVHMREVASALGRERFDLVVASPLRRSWRAAAIAGRGTPVQLEPDFREIDFGRWEGLTREEIRATDPVLHEDWQNASADFQFPNGEARSAFRERVAAAADRLAASNAGSALLVLHKGVIRAIVEHLTGKAPEDPEAPRLGEVLELVREQDGWRTGRTSSNPEGVDGSVSLEIEAPAA
jgi:broad specificity phosphatase PhoE